MPRNEVKGFTVPAKGGVFALKRGNYRYLSAERSAKPHADWLMKIAELSWISRADSLPKAVRIALLFFSFHFFSIFFSFLFFCDARLVR